MKPLRKVESQSNLRESFTEWEDIPEFLPEEVEQKYILGPIIGEGATCIVYSGLQVSTNAIIAAKKINEECLPQVLQESKLQASISHSNVPKVIDVFKNGKELYIIQEYAEGRELFDVLCERRLSSTDYITILTQLLSVVNHLHTNGIIHGDIKAENIMYDETTCKMFLVDFGSAFTVESQCKCTTGGSLGYLSPEMLKGERASVQSDLWAVGVLLYIMVMGVPPFFSDPDYRKDSNIILNAPFWFFNNACTQALYDEIKSGLLHDLDKLSPAIVSMLTNLLSLDPQARSSAEDFLEFTVQNLNNFATPQDCPNCTLVHR